MQRCGAVYSKNRRYPHGADGNPHVYREMNDVTGYLSRISGTQVSQTESMEESTVPEKAEADNEGGSTEPGTGGSESTTAEEASGETAADARPVIPAVDFELEDQYGNIHRLEDYRGKTIF